MPKARGIVLSPLAGEGGEAEQQNDRGEGKRPGRCPSPILVPERLRRPSPARGDGDTTSAAPTQRSALHDLAMLAIDDFVGPAAEAETLVEPVLGALIDGLALRPRPLPPGIWIAPRV